MDVSLIKGRLEAFQNKGKKKEYEKIDYTKFLWKPKSEGKYQIRIVPSKFNKEYPFKEVFIHYGYTKYPLYALTNWGEKDPIVEFAKKLKEGDYDPEKWKLSSKLEPKMRVFVPVIVRGEEDKGVRMWEFGKEIYQQLLGIADDEDYGDYTNVAEGRDFTIEAAMGDVAGRQMLKCTIRPKVKTSELSKDPKQVEEWLENQPDILSIQIKHDFDKMKSMLQNYLSPQAEDEEDTTEESSSNEEEVSDNMPWEKGKNISNQVKSKSDKFNDVFEDEK